MSIGTRPPQLTNAYRGQNRRCYNTKPSLHIAMRAFVRRIGLEPTTSTVSGWRSKPTELTPQNDDALLHHWPKDSTQQLRAHARKLFFYPSPRAMATFWPRESIGENENSNLTRALGLIFLILFHP